MQGRNYMGDQRTVTPTFSDGLNQGLLNRWTLQLDLVCTTGGLERVVSVHNST